MANVKRELQKAIYDRLTSGSSEISYKVYIDTPYNAQMPYVEIADIRAVDWSSKGEQGWNIEVDFLLWSDKTNQDIYDMEQAVVESITISYGASSPTELTMSSYTCIQHSFINSISPFKDLDNKTRRGVLTLGFLIHE